MVQCPKCGGSLKYQIDQKKVCCDYCSFKASPAAYIDSSGGEQDEYEVTVFHCPHCGGEIYTTDNSATGFCSYCGAFTTLESRLESVKKPQYIIPFRINKSECAEIYSKYVAGKFLAPKDFRDKKNLDRFRGIYMPYWIYSVNFDGPLGIQGTKSQHRQDCTVIDYYTLSLTVKMTVHGISFDAASGFNDEISAQIAPYDFRDVKPFSPGYLCGFYADLEDTDSSVYENGAKLIGSQAIRGEIEGRELMGDLRVEEDQYDRIQRTVSGITAKRAMFPVWFMSYRKKDRVAYAIVNGETGKMQADIPVDLKKLLFLLVAIALPTFFLLNLFLILQPKEALVSALLTGIITGFGFLKIFQLVRDQSMHYGDWGYQQKHYNNIFSYNKRGLDDYKVKKKKKIQLNGLMELVFTILYMVLYGYYWVAKEIFFVVSPNFIILAGILMLLALIYSALGTFRLYGSYQDKTILFVMCPLLLLEIISILPLFMGVPYDEELYYYVGCLAVFFGAFVAATVSIAKYNVLTTRALPQLERKGGNDHAPEL